MTRVHAVVAAAMAMLLCVGTAAASDPPSSAPPISAAAAPTTQPADPAAAARLKLLQSHARLADLLEARLRELCLKCEVQAEAICTDLTTEPRAIMEAEEMSRRIGQLTGRAREAIFYEFRQRTEQLQARILNRPALIQQQRDLAMEAAGLALNWGALMHVTARLREQARAEGAPPAGDLSARTDGTTRIDRLVREFEQRFKAFEDELADRQKARRAFEESLAEVERKLAASPDPDESGLIRDQARLKEDLRQSRFRTDLLRRKAELSRDVAAALKASVKLGGPQDPPPAGTPKDAAEREALVESAREELDAIQRGLAEYRGTRMAGEMEDFGKAADALVEWMGKLAAAEAELARTRAAREAASSGPMEAIQAADQAVVAAATAHAETSHKRDAAWQTHQAAVATLKDRLDRQADRDRLIERVRRLESLKLQ